MRGGWHLPAARLDDWRVSARVPLHLTLASLHLCTFDSHIGISPFLIRLLLTTFLLHLQYLILVRLHLTLYAFLSHVTVHFRPLQILFTIHFD